MRSLWLRSRTARGVVSPVFGLALVLASMPLSSGPRRPGPAVTVPGETATRLPDGSFLIVGGLGAAGPMMAAAIWDPRAGARISLPVGLEHARAWHTATPLPDGGVLIRGGVGADGGIVDAVERFHPKTRVFETLARDVAPMR
jgi:hypothetical protein